MKGYGDTHERGRAKFDKLAALLPRLRERGDAATLLEGLIKAALADEGGQALDKAIAELDGMPASDHQPCRRRGAASLMLSHSC